MFRTVSMNPIEQRTRKQTDTSGIYTWTFPTPYATGATPIIQICPEQDGSGGFWTWQIMSINNISVTIQITKTTAVTILGISVLGIQTNPQTFIHITALSP